MQTIFAYFRIICLLTNFQKTVRIFIEVVIWIFDIITIGFKLD